MPAPVYGDGDAGETSEQPNLLEHASPAESQAEAPVDAVSDGEDEALPGDADGNRADSESDAVAAGTAKKPRRARKSAAGTRKKAASSTTRRTSTRKPRAKRETPETT
jgi:hypothetical protein